MPWLRMLAFFVPLAALAQPDGTRLAAIEAALERGELERSFAEPGEPRDEADARYCLAYIALLQRRLETGDADRWLSTCRRWTGDAAASGAWRVRWLLAEASQHQAESDAKAMLASAQAAVDAMPPTADTALQAEAVALLGAAQRLLDQRAAARSSLERAAALYQQSAPASSAHLRTIRELAISYRLLGEMALFRSTVDRGLSLLGERPDPHLRSALLIQRATAENIRGDLVTSQRTLDEAAALLAGLPFADVARAVIDQNRALNDIEFGDLAAARRGLTAASAAERKLRPGSLSLARVHINLGRVHYQIGALAEAERAYAIAEPIVAALAKDQLVEAYLRSNQAELAAAQGRNEKAIAYFERALAINELQPRDCFCVGPTLRDYAVFLLSQNNAAAAEQALPLLKRALTLLQKFGNGDSQTLEVRVHLAEAYLAMARPDAARRELRAALPPLRERWSRSSALAQAWFLNARLAALNGDAAGARRDHCRAVDTLERIDVSDEGNGLSESYFRARYAEYYHACIGANLDAGDGTAAWRTLERARARSLRALWAGHRLAAAGEPQSLVDDWFRFQRRLVEWTRTATDPETDPAEAAVARDRLLAADAEREALLSALRKRAPRSAAWLIGGEAPNVALPAQTMMLAYSVGERDTLVLQRIGDRLGGQRLALPRAELASRVAAWRRQIAERDPGEVAAMQRSAERLYQDLLAPFAADLASTDRLLIVADGPLLSLPFAALRDADAQRYLVQTHRLRLLESQMADVANAAPPADALIVADARGQVARALPALPAAREEATAVRAAAGPGARLLLGAAASESAVKRAMPGAGLLHFAVHGISDPALPLESALVLSADAQDDGALTVRELLSMPPLRARRVVLSACESALGAEIRGDGLLSLARAFRQLGADSVVASLWPIADRSTAELMARLHRELKAGEDVDLALQRAQLALLRSAAAGDATLRGVGGVSVGSESRTDRSHPFYWAPFQIYGQGR